MNFAVAITFVTVVASCTPPKLAAGAAAFVPSSRHASSNSKILSTAFVTSINPIPAARYSVASITSTSLSSSNDDNGFVDVEFDDDSENMPKEGEGPNWIEKSSPTGIGSVRSGSVSSDSGGKSSAPETKDVDDYSLGISGVSFDTGPLSRRMYDALISVAAKRFPDGTDVPQELVDVYRMYSMDLTAKEATKAALKQNGLDMVEDTGEDSVPSDLSGWGEVEGIQLVDKITGEDIEDEIYDTFEEAVHDGDWSPGQPFNFIVRNVPATLKKMDLSDLLKQLDPTGELRAEVKEKGETMPDEEIDSLVALGDDCERRAEAAPREAQGEESVFAGGISKGYNIMQRSDLLADSINPDGTESRATLMHAMDAMVNHGCLIVDLTDGGATYKDAIVLAKMWEANTKFFDTINSDLEAAQSLPPIGVAEGAGSDAAKVGFSSYDGGRMQFLETRLNRENGALLPSEVADIIGADGAKAMKDAFGIISDIGKDALRVAVAAANEDADAFLQPGGGIDGIRPDPDMPSISGLTFEEAETTDVSGGDSDTEPSEEDVQAAAIRASETAALLARELMDDGRSIGSGNEGSVSMSPHRMCRYSDMKREGSEKSRNTGLSEIFGAHTDTSFITAVPVAAVSGLEVFDEEAECWFRPELRAREHWENEMEDNDEDSTALTEKVVSGDGEELEMPWHCRYVVLMPGELMQLVTRNEVPAVVHRVVAVTNGKARLSCPVLLRARSGMKMDTEKYLGKSEMAAPMLKECNGMLMQEIHDKMQPSSFKK